MSVKRKRTPLTIEQKSMILQRLDRGEKATKIALEYNIGKATVSDIKKARSAIEKFINQSDSLSALKRKSMKPAKDEQLDQAVFLWFSQQREKGIPVSGPMLQEIAISFQEQFHSSGGAQQESADHCHHHSITSGWLKRFKDRHGIRQLGGPVDKKSYDTVVGKFGQPKYQSIIREENYELEQFDNNAHHQHRDSGLFWHALPSATDKTPAFTEKKQASCDEVQKDRNIRMPKTAAERMREYRSRLNDDKRKQMQAKNREQQKHSRAKWDTVRRKAEAANSMARWKKSQQRKLALRTDTPDAAIPTGGFGLLQFFDVDQESRNEKLLKQMLYQMTPQAQQNQPQQKINISAALGKPVNTERSRKGTLQTALTCYSTPASQNVEVENDFLPAKKSREIHFDGNVSEASTIFTKPVFQPTIESPAQKSVTTSVKPLSVVLKPNRDIPQKQKRILVVPNHQQSVMSNLSSLWKAGRLCDAFIGNGTVNLKVHKMILGAVCPKVLDLFYDTPQHKLPKVTFPSSVSKDALLAFAEYMYNGVLDLDPSLLSQMKVIAQQLDMKDFEKLCSNQLKSTAVPTILPSIVEPMLEEPCSSSGLIQLTSSQSGQTVSTTPNNCGTDSFSNLPLVEVRAETDDTLMEVVNNNLTLSVAEDEGSICDINTSNQPWVKIENVDPDDDRYGRGALPPDVNYSTLDNISISTSNFTHISNTNLTLSSSSSSTSSSSTTNSKQNKSLPVGHTWKQDTKEKVNIGGDLDATDPYPIGLFTANWSNVPLGDQEIKKEYSVG